MSGFKDSEFMTVRDKELVSAQWRRFVERGFNFEHFTDRLYKHLTRHCSFIAHFNRSGFYSTYFENPEATIRFLRQFDGDHGLISVEYGSSWWLNGDYEDINRAMCEVVEANKNRLYEELERKVKARDLAIAGNLLAKHGISNPLNHGSQNPASSVSATLACDSCYHEIEDLSIACECLCHSIYTLALVRKAPEVFEPD
jgi:hypothetical protein